MAGPKIRIKLRAYDHRMLDVAARDIVATINSSEIPAAEKTEVIAQVDRVVNDYKGGTVAVRGSTEAAVGAAICRSGSTTGWPSLKPIGP